MLEFSLKSVAKSIFLMGYAICRGVAKWDFREGKLSQGREHSALLRHETVFLDSTFVRHNILFINSSTKLTKVPENNVKYINISIL